MELFCDFKEHGVAYTCDIHFSAITIPNMNIQSITGTHLEGKSDEDVEAIRFKDTTVNYFPQGLNKIFPNLKTVEIDNCGLKSITQRDLVGLENIRKL
ncbi:CLUMA_CG003804, isoform A, partial [Clunio marinus]